MKGTKGTKRKTRKGSAPDLVPSRIKDQQKEGWTRQPDADPTPPTLTANARFALAVARFAKKGGSTAKPSTLRAKADEIFAKMSTAEMEEFSKSGRLPLSVQSAIVSATGAAAAGAVRASANPVSTTFTPPTGRPRFATASATIEAQSAALVATNGRYGLTNLGETNQLKSKKSKASNTVKGVTPTPKTKASRKQSSAKAPAAAASGSAAAATASAAFAASAAASNASGPRKRHRPATDEDIGIAVRKYGSNQDRLKYELSTLALDTTGDVDTMAVRLARFHGIIE